MITFSGHATGHIHRSSRDQESTYLREGLALVLMDEASNFYVPFVPGGWTANGKSYCASQPDALLLQNHQLLDANGISQHAFNLRIWRFKRERLTSGAYIHDANGQLVHVYIGVCE